MRIHPAVLLIALGACKFEYSCGGDKVVQDKELEANLTTELGATKVDCPTGMKPEVGTTFECQVDYDGKTYPFVVTITQVNGDRFDSNAVPKQKAVRADKLRDAIRPNLETMFGAGVEMTCPEPLLPVADDATVRCTLARGDASAELVVKVKDDLTIDDVSIPAAGKTDAFEQLLAGSVKEKVGRDVQVDCADTEWLLPPKSGKLECALDGGAAKLAVEVTGRWDVNWTIVAPETAAAPQSP